MSIVCISLLGSAQPMWPMIAESVMWVVFAILLFRKKKPRAEQTESSVKPTQIPDTELNLNYVEDDTIIMRSDGKPITDSEIPYLVQVGREQATAKMRIPTLITQVQESYKIMYDTIDPETLCSRFSFASKALDELRYYDTQSLYPSTPSIDKLNELLSDDNYVKLIQRSFMRYMEKAKSELKTASGIEKRKQKYLNYIRNNVDAKILRQLKIF